MVRQLTEPPRAEGVQLTVAGGRLQKLIKLVMEAALDELMFPARMGGGFEVLRFNKGGLPRGISASRAAAPRASGSTQ